MLDDWIDGDDTEDRGVTVQNLTATPRPKLEHVLASLPAAVLKAEGRGEPGDISIVLTSDQHLAELHGHHLGDDSVTDVMTFPYDEPGNIISGDIVISVDRAAEQAVEQNWTVDDEIIFIAIHGMLHLCGWDDQDETARIAMHQRQREIQLSLEPEI